MDHTLIKDFLDNLAVMSRKLEQLDAVIGNSDCFLGEELCEFKSIALCALGFEYTDPNISVVSDYIAGKISYAGMTTLLQDEEKWLAHYNDGVHVDAVIANG